MISPLSDGVRLVECSSALSESRLYDLDYALNPYKGCMHGCLYCYAPDVVKAAEGWGSWVEARTNISRLLKKEIAGIGKAKIGLATVTDPYQPAEERLELTRACSEVIAQSEAARMLMTKSILAKRDFDVLRKVKQLEFCVTITTLDEEIAKILEPGAPGPGERLKLLTDASIEGFKTCAMVSPCLAPSKEAESNLVEMIGKLDRAGCSVITLDRLRLRPTGLKNIAKLMASENPNRKRLAAALHGGSTIPLEKVLKKISARENYPRITFEIPPMD
jgi:DNA repair photolyase